MVRVVLLRKDGVAEICPVDEMLAKSPMLQKATATPWDPFSAHEDERVRTMPYDVQRFFRRPSKGKVIYYYEIGPDGPSAA